MWSSRLLRKGNNHMQICNLFNSLLRMPTDTRANLRRTMIDTNTTFLQGLVIRREKKRSGSTLRKSWEIRWMRMSRIAMKTHPMMKTPNQISQSIQKAQKVRKSKRALMKAMMSENKICQQVVSALTSNARQKRSIKRSGRELNKTSTGFFVKIAMRTTTTIFIVSSASKSIQITVKMRMTISGLAVTTVNAGYFMVLS